MHSEPENQCKIFRHLDGAARVYLQDNYFTRKTSKLPDKKSYKKIKLWKIDTSFGVKAWINLISLLCNGSEIIIQYFNPEEFEQMFE
ncbi:hypothetical protein HW132_18190 [Brasilonema sp. CT11]|nr:hypothetical protein [Brasilonema sp. CT11]